MRAIRISYYEKDRLTLVGGPVRRAYERLREQLPDALIFARSGWVRGFHVDLCVLQDGLDERELTPAIRDLEAWLEEHPSTTALDPDAFLQMSKGLAALEGVTTPLEPLRPNNSIELVNYETPRFVDGHEILNDVYARFFSRSAPIIFEVAVLRREDPVAATMILTAMLAAAADELRPEGIARGVISLKAHADFFFANYDASGRARAHFEAFEKQWLSEISDAVERRAGFGVTGERQAQASEIHASWARVLRETRAEVEALADSNPAWFSYNPTGLAQAERQSAQRASSENRQHVEAFARAGFDADRTIKRGDTLEDVMSVASPSDLEYFSSKPFQVFRVLLNFYYSLLPTLSVSPAERFGLCFLVGRCVARGVHSAP